MTRKLTATITLMMLAFGHCASAEGIGWKLVNATIRSEFPNVKPITTADLAAWLDDSRRERPVLLDVRTEEEFQISHLRNARRVEPDAPASAVRLVKGQPIVTYCSVGYRSGRFAEKLRAAGYTNVANLEGSIFRWANEGRRVFRGAREVTNVHPYNRTWGLLLKRERRAEVAAARTKTLP